MKNIVKTLLFCLIVFIISCHKYPEDPFISFRRPGKRIEGTWNITSYQVNGVEHSHDFDSLLTPKTLTNHAIKFKDGGNYNSQGSADRLSGTYYFQDNDNNLLFSAEYNFEVVKS